MPIGSYNLLAHTGGRRPLRNTTISGSAEISTAQARFGSSSLFMTGDGTSSHNIGALSLGQSAAGTRFPNVAIEFFIRIQQASSIAFILFDAVGVGTAWEMTCSTGRAITVRTQDFSTGSSVTKSIVTPALTLDTWHHYATQRTGDTWGAWLDGVSAGTFTNTDFRESGTQRRLFASDHATDPIFYIDEFRISYAARYTPGTNFTAPSAAFVNDLNTVCLFHYEGANGATTTEDDYL
jgi:hypothetical protein